LTTIFLVSSEKNETCLLAHEERFSNKNRVKTDKTIDQDASVSVTSLNEIQNHDRKKRIKQSKNNLKKKLSKYDQISIAPFDEFKSQFPDAKRVSPVNEIDYDRLEFDIKKPWDYFDHQLADGYGKINYIKNVNSIAIMVYSILNQSHLAIYDVCFVITLRNKKQTQKVFLSNKKVEKIKPNSEIVFMETFMVQLSTDETSLDDTDLYVVIAGQCAEKKSELPNKLKILQCIRLKGIELQALDNIEDFKKS
jgi:hypothetical protein